MRGSLFHDSVDESNKQTWTSPYLASSVDLVYYGDELNTTDGAATETPRASAPFYAMPPQRVVAYRQPGVFAFFSWYIPS